MSTVATRRAIAAMTGAVKRVEAVISDLVLAIFQGRCAVCIAVRTRVDNRLPHAGIQVLVGSQVLPVRRVGERLASLSIMQTVIVCVLLGGIVEGGALAGWAVPLGRSMA